MSDIPGESRMIREPRTMRMEDVRAGVPTETAEVSPSACYLIALDADGVPGDLQRLGVEGVLVGRSQDCALQLIGPGVSRAHAYIWVDERGDAFLTDLGSTNGTRREGEVIPPAPRPGSKPATASGSAARRTSSSSASTRTRSGSSSPSTSAPCATA